MCNDGLEFDVTTQLSAVQLYLLSVLDEQVAGGPQGCQEYWKSAILFPLLRDLTCLIGIKDKKTLLIF